MNHVPDSRLRHFVSAEYGRDSSRFARGHTVTPGDVPKLLPRAAAVGPSASSTATVVRKERAKC